MSRRTAADPMLALGAVAAELPTAIAPQLATVAARPPVSGDWIYELKLDGYRMRARIDGGEARIYTRNGHDWTRKLSQLATALARLPVTRAWLDGELVALSADGLPDFNALQTGLAARPTSLTYFVFDLLHLNGYDLRPVPLRVRRALLHTLLEHHTHDLFRYSEAFAEDPQALLASVRALGLEGIIGKRADRPHQAGRSSDWIKLLARLRHDFVVAGVTRTRGTRSEIRTLLLGTYEADGTLRYVDSIEPTRRAPVGAEIARQITRLAQPTPAFRNPPRAAPEFDRVWLPPGALVAEVSFLE